MIIVHFESKANIAIKKIARNRIHNLYSNRKSRMCMCVCKHCTIYQIALKKIRWNPIMRLIVTSNSCSICWIGKIRKCIWKMRVTSKIILLWCSTCQTKIYMTHWLMHCNIWYTKIPIKHNHLQIDCSYVYAFHFGKKHLIIMA